MPRLNGAYVSGVSESDSVPPRGSEGFTRATIDEKVGCQNLVQRVHRLKSGETLSSLNDSSEEVFYVIEGSGVAQVEGRDHGLSPDMGLLVPPGSFYRLENTGSESLFLVSVISPQPGRSFEGQVDATLRPDGRLTVSASDQPSIPAGGDRHFKLLIDPSYGCRNLTQFVGFIERSRAPFHKHTYEEVIYILEGDGIVHVDDVGHPVGPGSSILLSPGTAHCIENPAEQTLKLLGIFCPAGDPGSSRR